VGALGACGCAPIAGGWWSGARTGLALVATTFAEGEERNRAMGVYGVMAGVGFVFGMVLGGVITQFLGWRWVLFVNVPVAMPPRVHWTWQGQRQPPSD
jgi:MFS family permease